MNMGLGDFPVDYYVGLIRSNPIWPSMWSVMSWVFGACIAISVTAWLLFSFVPFMGSWGGDD